MKNNVIKNFLINRDETGKFIVYSQRTGVKYYVEPIDGERVNWGDLNPATKKVEGSYGQKYSGSVARKESVLKEENGFKNVVELPAGTSPIDYINRIDELKFNENNKK